MALTIDVRFDTRHEFELHPAEPLDAQSARQWLEAQFVALDAEPLRASGKVLVADKVLAVAAAAGARRFAEDPAWAAHYAAAVAGALGKTVVGVDVEAATVTF